MMPKIERTLSNWIVEVLKQHKGLLGIVIAQRSKFERWLQLELASQAIRAGANNLQLESSALSHGRRLRSDLAFTFEGERHEVELKTANTNWRLAGVSDRTRPITLNIEGIIRDALKFRERGTHGLVGFVLFPIPRGDSRWHRYLDRIGSTLQIDLSERDHCARIEIPLPENNSAEAVVCCFPVAPISPN